MLVSKSSICDDGMSSTWWRSWENGCYCQLDNESDGLRCTFLKLVFRSGCVAPDICSSFVFSNLKPVLV